LLTATWGGKVSAGEGGVMAKVEGSGDLVVKGADHRADAEKVFSNLAKMEKGKH